LDPRRCAAHFARRRSGADDIWLDHDVARAADHQQMLDIVAADQNEPAAAIDAGIIDHGKPWLSPARAGAESTATEPSHRPGDCSDQAEHDEKGHEKAHGERHFRPEQALKHPRYSRLDGVPTAAKVAFKG